MAKLTEKQKEYLNNPIFLQKYLEILNMRLVYSNNRLELNNQEMDKLYDNANISSLDDNLKAFNILLNRLSTSNQQLTEELITNVANTINEHSMYISNNYRILGNNVKFEGKYPIEKPQNIQRKMQELLSKYYGEWSKLDIFEREAKFNIEFLRIHPFEDGNGRTSRLILNYNMIREGHAPILIPFELRERYFKARNEEDIFWIKEMFKKESQKELIALDILIDEYEKQNNHKKKH